MLHDILVCRLKIPGVSRKIWQHTKLTLDIIDSASEPKKNATCVLVCRGLKSLRTTALVGYRYIYYYTFNLPLH
jgi:hypothetical protein